MIVRGEGSHVYDDDGNRYIDGLSGLYCLNLGHSHGEELGAKAAAQMSTLAYTSNWTVAHPPAIELATKLAELAPDGFERAFFTSGGAEAVESAYKMAVQWHQANGEPAAPQGDRPPRRVPRRFARRALVHRDPGLPHRLRAARRSRPRTSLRPTPTAIPRAVATRPRSRRRSSTRSRPMIEFEQPETIAMIIMEPVQNAGGSIVPPAGYWQGLREICDKHGILLVSDEVICAFGRLGTWFGAQRLDYSPDLITFAKGLTGAYAAMGGVMISDKVAEPFLTARPTTSTASPSAAIPSARRSRSARSRSTSARGSSRTSSTTSRRRARCSRASRTSRSSATSAAWATSSRSRS